MQDLWSFEEKRSLWLPAQRFLRLFTPLIPSAFMVYCPCIHLRTIMSGEFLRVHAPRDFEYVITPNVSIKNTIVP